MTTLLSLVLLVLVAYLGSMLFHRFSTNKGWLKSLTYTGNLYLILGYIIGPQILNLINQEIIGQLNVLYALVLGWAGFLIGLQVNYKSLKRFQKIYYTFASANFLLAFGLSSLVLILVFNVIPTNFQNVEIIILAIAGAVTSPIMLGVILREFKVRGKISHILQFVSGYDNILGIVILGLIMASISNIFTISGNSLGPLVILISIAIGVMAAYLYYYLSKDFKSDQEIFLLVIGLLIFIVGIAFLLKQSLLFIAFVFGVGLSNLKINTKKLYLNIQQVEKPLYILLLIFVGANITIESKYYLIYLLIFLLIHLIVIVVSGFAANMLIQKKLHISGFIGLANLGMGGLSLAIILDFHLTNPSSFSNLLIFILAISLIVNDLISYKFLEKFLVKKFNTGDTE